MRSPTSGLNATLTAVSSQPGYLVMIAMPAATLRLTSLSDNFSYGGYSWQSADITISSIGWEGGGMQPGNMVIGDSDLVFWAYAMNLQLQDAAVSLWACDGGAPDEAEPLWSGQIGEVARDDQQVSCALRTASDVPLVPRRRCQQLVPSYLLAPPGTTITVRGQAWVLDRQFDVARAQATTAAQTRRDLRTKPPGRTTVRVRKIKG